MTGTGGPGAGVRMPGISDRRGELVDAAPDRSRVSFLPAVAIVDATPTFRRGLRAALSDVGFAVDEPADPIGWAREHDGGVVLGLRTHEDWARLVRLRAASSEACIVAVIPELAIALYARALAAGAVGVVHRGAELDEIVRAVTSALQGATVIPSEVAHALVADTRFVSGDSTTETAAVPTDSDLDLVSEMAEGVPIAELADKIGYSDRQLRRRLADVYRRLGASQRTQAIENAKRWGLIE